MAIKEVLVPDIGNFDSVDVIEVLVKPGDSIAKDDSLITLESDKASMDIPAPYAGTVKEVKLKVGDKVSQGTVILLLDAAESVASTPPSPLAGESRGEGGKPAPTPPIPPATHPAPEVPKPIPPKDIPNPICAHAAFASGKLAHASPSVRKFARELGANLALVRGSGPKGRVLKEDVQAYIKGELSKPRSAAPSGGLVVAETPVFDFSKFGETESRPLSRIKKLSGANLHRNWVTAPHVTQFEDADITDLEEFRKTMMEEAGKRGVKLTLLAFLVKAAASALEAYPNFNASLSADGESLILKKYCNIGFACDTPDGLVVPVIRDADRKDVLDIARDLGELSAKAREKKLKLDEMQGGCFTISSLGGIGGTAFTPIINCPEVAILGVSRSSMAPVYNAKTRTFEPRLILPLSLSYDHRVIDGADGARFTGHLRLVLSDVRRLLL